MNIRKKDTNKKANTNKKTIRNIKSSSKNTSTNSAKTNKTTKVSNVNKQNKDNMKQSKFYGKTTSSKNKNNKTNATLTAVEIKAIKEQRKEERANKARERKERQENGELNYTLINWFPGHMKKTKEMIADNLKLVDLVIEIIDVRLPISSRNPDIDKIIEGKPRLIIANKVDLADEEESKRWRDYYKSKNINALFMSSAKAVDKKLIVKNAKNVIKDILEKEKKQGRKERAVRAMIVGIPNVGKSTFINQLVKKKITQVGNKPGVTRGKQWIKVDSDFDLLDTPGVLWPKFEDQEVARKLAFIGTINQDILELYELSLELIDTLIKKPKYAKMLITRYKLDDIAGKSKLEIFNMIGNARGFKAKDGDVDIKRTSRTIIDEFKNGKIGNITLDEAPRV